MCGVGREEGVKNNPGNGRRKKWGGRDRLKSNNKRQSLGVEWEVSEVGIPPPHNLDNHHALVESINNILLNNVLSSFWVSTGCTFFCFSKIFMLLIKEHIRKCNDIGVVYYLLMTLVVFLWGFKIMVRD